MTAEPEPRGLIWATRGRRWGFRFLLSGNLPDPLREYEAVLAGLGEQPSGWHRAVSRVGLRFPDPMGRQDAAGRVITHDFVLYDELADQVGSLAEGVERIWPLVAAAYDRVWDSAGPPAAADLRFTR